MSVRQRQHRSSEGKVTKMWQVDVNFTHATGRVERIRKDSPVNTRRGAEDYERQLRTSLLDGTFGRDEVKEVPTLEAFQGRFLDHALTNNKPSTLKSKRDILRRHLVPYFGKIRLDRIDASKIEAFKTEKAKGGLSKKSINNVLACLGKLLSLAKEWKEISETPPLGLLKAPRPQIDFLTFEEAEQLQQRAEPGRWRCMIVLALNTGLRLGELCALQWGDCDLATGRMVVRRNVYRGNLGTPKGGRDREIPLNADATQALKDMPKRLACPWVFPQKDGGFIRNPQHTCAEAIHRQAELAGLRTIGWHCLRHTVASHLVMKGVPLPAVKELLGHADIATTMRYAHLMPNINKDAVRLLETGNSHGNGNRTATAQQAVA